MPNCQAENISILCYKTIVIADVKLVHRDTENIDFFQRYSCLWIFLVCRHFYKDWVVRFLPFYDKAYKETKFIETEISEDKIEDACKNKN